MAQARQTRTEISARHSEDDPTALDMKILAPVLDPVHGLKTPGVREEEREAYYYVLQRTREIDYELQKAAARRYQTRRRAVYPDKRVRSDPKEPFPIFVDLYRNADRPEVYFGKLVTLSGHVRLLREIPAGQNPYGIQTLYEAWLYTPDSQSNPACIVCTEVPAGMLKAFRQSRSHLLDGVTVTGYFFKMMVYRAQDAPRFAPLILARRLEWHPPAPRKQRAFAISSWLVLAVVVVVGGLIVAGLVISDRRHRRRRTWPAEVEELWLGDEGTDTLETDGTSGPNEVSSQDGQSK
ncbi:MAG: hypothetical protein GXP27_04485 [Planctomycetes bacterium]|nr:hypothetical protein [Planctomycetota bacterium]